MKANDALKQTLQMSAQMLTAYLEDLSDQDLFIRPVSGANHTAWQLGHLIAGENMMVNAIKPGASPELPKGFADAYSEEMSRSDDKAKFHTKQTYLELFRAQREASAKILESLSDTDFDRPAPEAMRSWAPTVGYLMNIVATHVLMHLGQITVVRRKLGKPLIF